MSSCVIRKEDQPVCQPWEISSFDVASHPAKNADADQVKLHFEIRSLGKPVDPMRYLPRG